MTTINAASNSKFVNDTTANVAAHIEKQKARLQSLRDSDASEKELSALATSIRSNTRLLAALTTNKDVCSIIATHKIDIDAMLTEKTKNTREAKKRLLQHLEAIAQSDVTKLAKCDQELYSALVHERDRVALDKALTTAKIQHIMKHATKTQANYFSNFAEHMKIAEIKRKNKNEFESVTVLSNSALMKKISALFA